MVEISQKSNCFKLSVIRHNTKNLHSISNITVKEKKLKKGKTFLLISVH